MKKKILLAVLLLGMIGTVSAQTTIDDFEDGDMSEYSGTIKGSVTTGSPVYSGSYSYKGGGGQFSSTSGLNSYPSQGTTITFWMYADSSDNPNSGGLTFGAQCSGSFPEGYQARADWSNNEVVIYEDTNPDCGTIGESALASSSATVPTDEWLRGEVEWRTDGTIIFTLYDSGGNQLGQVSTTDNSHSSGGIGTRTGNPVIFDNIYYETNDAPTYDSVATDPVDPNLNDLVDVEANISDDGSVTSVTGSYSKDGTTQSSGDAFSNTGGNTWRINDWINVDEADSTYSYTLTATDGDGASTTYTDSFTVQDSSAGLKAAKPKNITYSDPAPYDVYLNNDNDSVENETASCELYADGSQFTSFTLEEGGAHETGNLPVLGDGTHSFTASCIEDQGTSVLDNVYREFDIDNTEPDLNITHPVGKLDIKTNIDLNYTVTDASTLDQCTYNIDGEANVTLSNCGNTTFSRNEVGEHTVNLWATDIAGNTAYDSQLFTADYENTVELNDADTGSAIQDFSVVLTNGDTEGGSTSDGVYEFFTTEMPKGDVNMTLKSDGYQTRTIEFSNVDNTFELNQEYEMTRAGIYIDAVDEQTQEDLQFSFVARNSTVSYNKTNITEFDEDLRDLSGFPTGDVTLTVTHPDDTYRPRQYFLDINENSRTMLTAYLLKRGQGLFTSVEVVDGEQNAIQGALVNIQRLYGTQWKTVVQKETTSSGGQSFYLDPDISYRAYVTHPNYVGFQGTFSPANYQYEPLIIQLGTSGAYNFTTRWDSISYKIEPQTQSLEGEGSQTFNYTVMDSQNALTEFGLKFWHNGTVVSQDSVKDSPSGGTVSLTEALGNYSDGENVKVEGYFLSDQEYYSVNRTYVIRKGFDQGVFSINAIFYELKKSLGETGEAFLALIATFLTVLGTRKTQFTNATMDGALALLVLGIFTWKQMFPGFIFILTLLLLIGVWASRRV